MANKAKWDQIVDLKTACVPNKEVVKRLNVDLKQFRMREISFMNQVQPLVSKSQAECAQSGPSP